jgi:hypothetical protein
MFVAPETVLERLDESLDLLASLRAEDAETIAVQLQARSNRLQALTTVAVGAVDRSSAIGNAKSTAAWFAHATRIPKRDATMMVRNARAMRSMPGTAAAFTAGEISGEHVQQLARAHDLNPKAFETCEDELLDSARQDRFDQFCRHLAYWRQLAEPDVVEDEAAKLHDDRDASASTSFDGMVFVSADLDPVGGSIFKNELDRLEHLLWEDDQRTSRARTNGQRRADALVLMAERSAAMPENAKRARVLISVLVGYETFAGRICQLADGTVLTPGQVVSLLDDADIQRVIFDGPSRVLDIGVKQRLFTGATRTAVNLVHLECQGDASCDTPSPQCETDHIQPWELWGPTTQDNGRPLCKWHHRRRQRGP